MPPIARRRNDRQPHRGPVHQPEPALDYAHDHPEPHPGAAPAPVLRLPQRAPSGVGVKDLRPLRGRPCGSILDTNASTRRAQQQAENSQNKDQDHNRGLTGPAPSGMTPRHTIRPPDLATDLETPGETSTGVHASPGCIALVVTQFVAHRRPLPRGTLALRGLQQVQVTGVVGGPARANGSTTAHHRRSGAASGRRGRAGPPEGVCRCRRCRRRRRRRCPPHGQVGKCASIEVSARLCSQPCRRC